MKFNSPSLFAGLLVVTSCGAAPGPIEDTRGPIEECVTPAQFFGPYREALNKLEGRKIDIDQTEMVHLGMPTETSVVIWHSLAEGVKAGRPFEVFLLDAQDGEARVPAAQLGLWVNAEHGTGRIDVTGLTPGTAYRLAIQGGGLKSRRVIRAATKPDQKAPFSFLAASCFLPWNYSEPTRKHTFIAQETTAVLRSLEARSRAQQERGTGPSFYLGLGDQLYVDPGADVKAEIAYLHGKHSEKMRGTLEETPLVLRTLYRYHFGLQPMDRAFSQIPSAMMWDDHDIRDGWGSQRDENGTGWVKYYGMVRESFLAFQGSRNPIFAPEKRAATTELPLKFSWGAGEFFILDGRSGRTIKDGKAQSYSPEQFGEVKNWLNALKERKGESLVFVFGFPVPLVGGEAISAKALAKTSFSISDDTRERAYVIEEERNKLLAALLCHARAYPKHRLLILSGDVHYSGIQVIQEQNSDVVLGYEIVSSGLAQTDFNSMGPLVAQVARSVHGARVNDHGFYAGPSFAEIFIGPQRATEPPEVRVLFYPAAERPSTMRGSRLKQFSTLFLDVSAVDFDFARRPEDYPANSPRFSIFPGRKITVSHLGEYIILDQWLGTGRARRGEAPTNPAVRW